MKIPFDRWREPLIEGLKPLVGLSFEELMAHPAIEYPGLEIRRARIFDGSRRNVRNIRYVPGAGGWSGEATLYGQAIKVSLPRVTRANYRAMNDPVWRRY